MKCGNFMDEDRGFHYLQRLKEFESSTFTLFAFSPLNYFSLSHEVKFIYFYIFCTIF